MPSIIQPLFLLLQQCHDKQTTHPQRGRPLVYGHHASMEELENLRLNAFAFQGRESHQTVVQQDRWAGIGGRALPKTPTVNRAGLFDPQRTLCAQGRRAPPL